MRICIFSRAFFLCCLLIPVIAGAQIQNIYINPKAQGIAKQSQFVDSIRFIPLEIKKDIELGSYNSMDVTDQYFLITIPYEKVLLIYSRSGKFIRKISYRKLGDSFYPAYREQQNQIVFFGNNKNYTLTQKDQLEIMLNWDNPRNKKYFKKFTIDLADTSFTIKKDTPNQNDIIRSYELYDGFFWQGRITTSSLFKDSLDYEFKIYKNNQLVRGFFPYNPINEPRFLHTNENTSFTVGDIPGSHYITRPYCDTVYKMVNDSLYPLYRVVLPLENSLPPSFFSNRFKNKTERENFRRNNGWMLHQVYNFRETPEFIHLMIGYLSNFEAYVYHKKNNVTYKLKNIRPDTSQYNLQLLGDYTVRRKGDKLYKSQTAGDLTTFFEQNKNVAVPKEIEGFLKVNPPAGTPVIIEFKLRN